MTFSLPSSVFSRELRKSSGSPPENQRITELQGLEGISREKSSQLTESLSLSRNTTSGHSTGSCSLARAISGLNKFLQKAGTLQNTLFYLHPRAGNSPQATLSGPKWGVSTNQALRPRRNEPESSVPSSSFEKGKKVVSSLRFLLKSMQRTLSFFLIALIFYKMEKRR